MVPAAPGRLSITTGCPKLFASGSLTIRAVTSTPVPGPYGTTIRSGFDGYCCAFDVLTDVLTAISASNPAATRRGGSLIFLVLSRDFFRHGKSELTVLRIDVRVRAQRIAGDRDHVILGRPHERHEALRV